MAGIDKTFTSSWKDYKELREWAQKTRMEYPHKEKGAGYLIDWFYEPDLTEKDFKDGKEEHVIWDTPESVDRFLRKNCPLAFVQERLKEQYGKGYDDLLKPHVDPHIEKKGKLLKLKFLKTPDAYEFRSAKYGYTVSVGDTLEKSKTGDYYVRNKDFTKEWYYYRNYGKFFRADECREDTESELTPDYLWIRHPNKRKLIRLARKWNLPAGLYIEIIGSYVEDQWILKTV